MNSILYKPNSVDDLFNLDYNLNISRLYDV